MAGESILPEKYVQPELVTRRFDLEVVQIGLIEEFVALLKDGERYDLLLSVLSTREQVRS